MADHNLSPDELAKVFMNPFYAIDIAPSLIGEHEKAVTKDEWVQGNMKVIEEIGLDKWLHGILDVLETGGVGNPQE